MLDFRGKYVAHIDLRDPFKAPIPHFEPALHVAYTYQEWVRELISPVVMSQQTLSSQYELCKAEASSIFE
jgi:hypothetical protein